MSKPKLLPVPCFLRELTIKADLNGVTILKDGRYRKRYVGSKQYAVDINGILRKSADLAKLVQPPPEVGRRQKKGPSPESPNEKINSDPMANKQHTSGLETPPREKKYSINKPEIRQRLFAMIHSQPAGKRELYFWTVTFPAQTGDALIYRLFNTWLTRLRTEKILLNYLWVAERQQNGTLHFHLAIPHKMPVKRANSYMSSCLVSASKAGEIDFNVWQCKRYNGVDIAKNRKEKKVTNFALGKRGQRALVTYITKYITKNEGTFTSLAWHNSRGFSQLFTGVTFTVDEFQNVYLLTPFVRRHSAVSNEYFQFHPWVNGPPPQISGELLKLNTYIQSLN